MTFLLDVNVFMAVLWENHEHHQVARTWFRGITDFVTCPVAQLGFARVSSLPALGYSMSPDQAFSILRSFLADARHHFVSDDLSCEDRGVRTDLMAGANQITDHYLVAIAPPPSFDN
jgi:toxin-antitoxin system PIN domain toxin